MFNDLIIDGNYQQELIKHTGYSLIDGLECIAMSGFLDMGYGRAIAWALLSKYANKHMLRITKAVKKAMVESPYKRIEITVEEGFDEAVRWAYLLGMKYEAKMLNYCDGKSHYLFARIK